MYFRPFINETIFHAENYYAGYEDFNRMIVVFKYRW